MRTILFILGFGYFLSVGIFGLYYNYLYAIENGFWAWVFFGEIVASLKALIWPYFEFF